MGNPCAVDFTQAVTRGKHGKGKNPIKLAQKQKAAELREKEGHTSDNPLRDFFLEMTRKSRHKYQELLSKVRPTFKVGNLEYNADSPNDEAMMKRFLAGDHLIISFTDYEEDIYNSGSGVWFAKKQEAQFETQFEGYGSIEYHPMLFGEEPNDNTVKEAEQLLDEGVPVRYIILKPTNERDPKGRRNKIANLTEFDVVRRTKIARGTLAEPDAMGNIQTKNQLKDEADEYRIRFIPFVDHPFLSYMQGLFAYKKEQLMDDFDTLYRTYDSSYRS